MRVIALAAFVVFSVFALTQLDDATSFTWVLIYGFAAMVSLMAAIGVRVTLPALVGVAGYAALTWKLGPGPGYGLILCIVWTTFLFASQIRPLERLNFSP